MDRRLELQTEVRIRPGVSAARFVTSTRGLAVGRCHICRSVSKVEHLVAVGHWICIRCQVRLGSRGANVLRAMCQGESLDCCGPMAKVD